MWTIILALPIIRSLQSIAHTHGYHITLGGGVLNKGGSNKDLDLFVLRKNNTERTAPSKVEWALYKASGCIRHEALRDHPDYGPDADFHFSEAHKWTTVDGKRIDVFVQ